MILFRLLVEDDSIEAGCYDRREVGENKVNRAWPWSGYVLIISIEQDVFENLVQLPADEVGVLLINHKRRVFWIKSVFTFVTFNVLKTKQQYKKIFYSVQSMRHAGCTKHDCS